MLEGSTVTILLVGPPGSGKSTMASYLKTKLGAEIISSDNIRKLLYGNESVQKDNERVFNTLYSSALSFLINHKQSVIIDSTNCLPKYREEAVKTLKPSSDIMVAVVMDLPLDECLRLNSLRDRKVPDYVIENMHTNLKRFPVLKEEGFDYIVNVCSNDWYFSDIIDIPSTDTWIYHFKMLPFSLKLLFSCGAGALAGIVLSSISMTLFGG